MAIANKCLFYKVSIKPGTMEPIVSTMMAYPTPKIAHPCSQALVPNYQMVAPVGKSQCFPVGDGHLRYFYKIDQYGQIVPNSMWSQHGAPNSMCSGNFQILEYKLFA